MDTLDMVDISVGLGPPRILDRRFPPYSAPDMGLEDGDTQPQVTDTRVDCVAKKGRALYHEVIAGTTL